MPLYTNSSVLSFMKYQVSLRLRDMVILVIDAKEKHLKKAEKKSEYLSSLDSYSRLSLFNLWILNFDNHLWIWIIAF